MKDKMFSLRIDCRLLEAIRKVSEMNTRSVAGTITHAVKNHIREQHPEIYSEIQETRGQ